ncbi:MAG: aminotransferase class I/II-fold pyridoxal phosphate-dependent enzyme [SAR324 cluster bacterium]|nr:aminotransferase class I/II-fold pyridoxal phosphate-dependent enzyme [SAR324 cluster bacterium]
MKVRSAIREMKAYSPPLEGRTEGDFLLLDFSESTLPPPEGVREAIKAFLDGRGVQVYPSYSAFEKQLTAYARVAPGQLIVTNGSDSAIQLITSALLSPGDEMIMAKPGFAVIENCAVSIGAKVVSPLYRPPEMAFPLEDLLAAVTERTALIVIINPNNPTGSLVTVEQIESVLSAFPEVAVMVDEAYYEFSGLTAVPLLERYGNLVITRTFSKAFALAGLRLGYALSNPDFITQLHKLRNPYNVNMLAVVAAGAQLAAPEGWKAYVTEVMERAKPRVERFLSEHGVAYYPSGGNFLLVRPDDPQAAADYLRQHGILVRPQRPPVEDTFRLSIGTAADMELFMEVFARYPGLDASAGKSEAAP